jgi:hypothetical protein
LTSGKGKSNSGSGGCGVLLHPMQANKKRAMMIARRLRAAVMCLVLFGLK